MKTDSKTISLNSELAELHEALDAAHILSRALQNYGLASQEDQRRAPGAISAVLSLVQCRLRNLEQVVRGTLDAKFFWARHNDGTGPPAPGDDADVLLGAGQRAQQPVSGRPRKRSGSRPSRSST
jgi:hypothetical protein